MPLACKVRSHDRVPIDPLFLDRLDALGQPERALTSRAIAALIRGGTDSTGKGSLRSSTPTALAHRWVSGARHFRSDTSVRWV